MRKIPVTVITGFLGAGKTTLVRHLMSNAQGRRIALVVNEFGDVGVDRELLLACNDAACQEDDIVELANGCLCCTVADDFLPAMTKLIECAQPPEHILVETSGLALPKPLVKAFGWPGIKTKATVDGVVTVVDGPAVAAGRFASSPEEMARPDHENPLDEVFSDQLACSDLVLLNKTDLMDAQTLAALTSDLKARLRQGVKLVATHQGNIAPEILLGLSAAAEDDLEARPSLHDAMGEHDHEDFESFILELGAIANLDDWEAKLKSVIATHDILRVKGFLDVPGKPMRLALQGVGMRIERYFDRPWNETEQRASRLVVIGQKGLDNAAITAALLD
ncbi:MAG: cobalamin biosynthesis protein CobW [Alphaproteobacteria bacterium]|nr:cobalamin biosynthesis protein CobW [Alphaproteobacteria bacterium]